MIEEKFEWKCDICGTRFNNFQAEGFNQKIYCPLCFFKELNKQNEQQLQAYKDKEDKLREYCKETPIPFKDEVNKWAEDGRTWAKDAILQILNEGDK